jgi:transcriptional regulator with XRE-family HTH domain
MILKRAPKPTDKYVGGRVRMRRLELRISQADLAERLGLSFQQVQKYENGTNRIGAGRLQHTAGILKVPVTFFFEGAPRVDGTKPASVAMDRRLTDLTAFMTTPEGLALAKSFMRISNLQLRRRIVGLVEEIDRDRR